MNPIKYAKFLERLSALIAVMSIIGLCLNWTHDILIENLSLNHSFLIGLVSNSWQDTAILKEIPWLHRMIGFIVDAVSVGIFILGLQYFILFTKSIQNGKLFAPEVINYFNDTSKCALWWAVYQPIKRAILSTVMSLHNPPGQRVITLDFGSDDIMNIFLCAFLMLIALMIKEAYYLKQEQDLII